MGCNTSQVKMTASTDVDDANLKNSNKLLDNNENEKNCGNNTNELLDDILNYGEDEEFAATKIQAAFRGHKTRIIMRNSTEPTNLENSKKAAESADANAEPTKAELEAEFDPNDKELCDAAAKIQATFRGHLTRKLQAQAVDSKDKLDVNIDEITKKVAEELDIDLADPELNKAASKIQASFRGRNKDKN